RSVLLLRLWRPPSCILFPYTTLFRSAPLLKAGVIDASHLIADCKSGVSGAGRKAEVATLFSEAGDNFKAYGVSGHRHLPETLERDRKSTRLNSSHVKISYAVFCLKKK